MLYLKIFVVFFTAAYVFLLLYYISSWLKEKIYSPSQKEFSTFASILIPARNEEHNIENILTDIFRQNFPANLYEVIVVDDNSEDNTKLKTENLIRNQVGNKIPNLKFLESIAQGKKNAILTGINRAKGELIITTDADCRMGKNWLSTIVSFYEKYKPEMIIAPVCFHNEKNLFGKMQSLEFISLLGITAGSALANNPLMCNGANLAYKKKSFFSVNGFDGNEKTPSGDDVLLMLKLKKKYPGKIKYLKSREGIVFTEPQQNFSGFINQRLRWVSKSSFYSDFSLNAVSWFVLLFNLSILIFGALSFFKKGFAEIFLVSFLAKIFIDFLFLLLTASFFRRKSLLWLYFPLQIIYVFYVPLIAVAGLKKSFVWKGRGYE